ncbi:OmpA family protein [Hymenobacter koreensis]|uniref:OmpA family protein n=2 Tax=Hymenobacter koreensis TaxID=1084523 RepID=A0ABP8ITB9_9BACT
MVVLPAASLAQTADRPTSVSLHLNALQYRGTFGSTYWDFSSSNRTAGLGLGQYLGKGLDLNGQVLYGDLKGTRGPNATFNTTLINVNLGLKFKLNNGWALKENAFIQPYLLAAPGWTYTSREVSADGLRNDQNENLIDLFTGAGINFRLGGVVGFFVQTGQHLPLNANFDGSLTRDADKWDDRFLQHTAGLTINLGQGQDQDQDEVPDRKDRCPNTPPGTPVDDNGCPLDDDHDGVANFQDQCPSEAGTAENQGCPEGAADADNDGVNDSEDKCPDTPPSTAVDVNGCPTANPDAAPAEGADTDRDGVPDADDRCPSSAGPAANRGCPEIKAETRAKLQEATRFMGFELNKATLLPASYSTLDDIVQILRAYPDYTLSIAGHTDSKGSTAFNLRLARERAASAGGYLRSKGVAENRIVLRSYGPLNPIADNSSDAGRAENRRVEFDLFLTGDPNPAETKYGPQPPIPAVAPAVKKDPAKATKVKKGAVRKAPARKTAAKKSATKAPAKAAPAQKPAPKAATPKATAPSKTGTRTNAPAPRR